MNIFKKVLLVTLVTLASVSLATAKLDSSLSLNTYTIKPAIGKTTSDTYQNNIQKVSLSDSELESMMRDYSLDAYTRNKAVLVLAMRYVDRSNYGHARRVLTYFNHSGADSDQLRAYDTLRKLAYSN
ncbi:hypothetical protein CKF54_04070 [Psittacicella hinzii]|uniref:DUF4476 domain-containing protein n=1 Tax=Psittacicella hinzii TaxID=2028575 RepID=A0A3A1Y6E7_9GAMM|nr:hypothetical protein [Psittacicella hinzii]RIY32876.1 hypothetical protein CKF54_04070 [Psittacicella hinzii]